MFLCGLALPREVGERSWVLQRRGRCPRRRLPPQGSSACPDGRLVRYDTIDTLRYAMKSRLPSSDAHNVSHASEAELEQRAMARARFQQEAQNSWLEFQKSGLHFSGEEVYAWLDTWGTSNEKPMPECHN